MQEQQQHESKLTQAQLAEVSGGVAIEALPTPGDIIDVPKEPIYVSLILDKSVGGDSDILS